MNSEKALNTLISRLSVYNNQLSSDEINTLKNALKEFEDLKVKYNFLKAKFDDADKALDMACIRVEEHSYWKGEKEVYIKDYAKWLKKYLLEIANDVNNAKGELNNVNSTN